MMVIMAPIKTPIHMLVESNMDYLTFLFTRTILVPKYFIIKIYIKRQNLYKNTSKMSRRIFFCAVMQDEAITAKRFLDSASKIAATILISDGDPITSEPTETMLAIEEWKRTHPKHTVHVVRRPWRDFGYNKTWLLHETRKLITQPNCYIAFCDADEVFVTDAENPTSYLNRADVQRLLKEMDGLPQFNIFQMQTVLHRSNLVQKYPRWQILRNDQPYRWFMPYQETLEGLKSTNIFFLNWIFNYSRSDGNSARHPERNAWAVRVMEKYISEISKNYDEPVVDEFAFLYDELKDDMIGSDEDEAPIEIDISTSSSSQEEGENKPRSFQHPEKRFLSRSVFYLATNVDIERAKSLLRLRVSLGPSGDMQELYVAYLRLGMMTSGEERRKALVEATHVDSTRLEAYYYLMKDCIDAEDHRRAAGWVSAAPARDDPPSHAFASETEIYQWRFNYWASVALEHACRNCRGDPGSLSTKPALYYFGLDLIHKAMNSKHIPEAYLNRAKINEKIYLRQPESVKGLIHSGPSTSHLEEFPRVAPLFTTLIIDDFYSNPDAVRHTALTADYPVKGNYPGNRTKSYLVPGIKERLETIVGRKITYWPTSDTSYNGAFQRVMAKEGWSSIHRDKTDYSVVIFLTPGAPIDSGTNIYQHETGISKSNGDQTIENRLNQDYQNDAAWDITVSCGNLYNRAIFFDGRLSHRAGAYFGDCMENCRLFQTFFFDVEK